MQYIECPSEYSKNSEPSVYLAGGITDCPNWQLELVDALEESPLAILNPRRNNFPLGDATASENQIRWEYKHLHVADIIAFWFPKESICPIALFELGSWLVTEKPLLIGIHPEYSRISDVEIQSKLARRNVKFYYNLSDLAFGIKKEASRLIYDIRP